MLYPTVLLEDSSLVSGVLCEDDSITITLATQTAYALAESSWATNTNMVLITNSQGCNAEYERGAWLVSSSGVVTVDASRTITLPVQQVNLQDVASSMVYNYGYVNEDPDTVAAIQAVNGNCASSSASSSVVYSTVY